MATNKTITIHTKGQLNSTAITIVVLLEPFGIYYDKFEPIVWRVGSWKPTGAQSMASFTWSSNYAFSAFSDPKLVYRPIKDGEETSLQKLPNGVYYWTDPTPITGSPGPVARNRTGSETNIGYGFVVNLEGMKKMENAIVYENVVDQKSVTASFSPTMNVYIFKTAEIDEKEYVEGQRLSSLLPTSAKRWSSDLRTLDPTTADLTLSVTYNPITGEYDVAMDHSLMNIPSEADCGYVALARVLNATVCFNTCINISAALRVISETLGPRGFTVDIVDYGCTSYSGDVQLTLPRYMSCSNVEAMLNELIGSGAKITEISGRCLLSPYDVYIDINPASREWYSCRVGPLPPTGCPFVIQDNEAYKTAVKEAVEGVAAAIESFSINGNGNTAAAEGKGVAPARKATLGSRPSASEIFAAA